MKRERESERAKEAGCQSRERGGGGEKRERGEKRRGGRGDERGGERERVWVRSTFMVRNMALVRWFGTHNLDGGLWIVVRRWWLNRL